MSKHNSHRPQPLKNLDGMPVFEQEWQAQVLAMADTLITNKLIEPTRWSETFGAKLANAHAAGQPDDMATYYAAALDTLEELIALQGTIAETEMSERRDAWKQAYLRTPHGQPVKL